ncbi:hypothetical protein HGB24_01520 [Candidatus Saccharibacteria bacterium]|nr:hypothetical protein [Candidatus Saccharibacteria bacterium]
MGHLSIGTLLYIIIGVLVANANGYLVDMTTLPHIVSAVLAIALWPLILLQVNLHVSF